jgi:hypothetical protein
MFVNSRTKGSVSFSIFVPSKYVEIRLANWDIYVQKEKLAEK